MANNYCKCGKEIPITEKKCEQCKRKQKKLLDNLIKVSVAASSVLLFPAIKVIKGKFL